MTQQLAAGIFHEMSAVLISEPEQKSKQVKWREKKLAEGLCIQCGKRKNTGKSNRCPTCIKKDRIRNRKVNGLKPKKKGKRGRPITY